jgi:hypothetical protein
MRFARGDWLASLSPAQPLQIDIDATRKLIGQSPADKTLAQTLRASKLQPTCVKIADISQRCHAFGFLLCRKLLPFRELDTCFF